jgi:hypothetical protein
MKLPNYEEFLNEAAKFSGNRSHSMFAMQSLSLRDQIHVWHWQTDIGDAHSALGDFYGSIIDSVDEIMEITMGKYGRVSVKGIGTPPPLIDLSDANVEEYLTKYVDLYNEYKRDTFVNDADIQNKLDEVVADINKLKYLLTMK